MHDLEDPPFCCAVVRGGTVTLNAWGPRLVRGGPAAMALERLADAGVALYDLRVLDGAELVATPARGSAQGERVEQPLLDWAATVGYARVWLPGRVVDLDGVVADAGVASTTCRVCGLAWRDGTPAFWAAVREDGHFPGFCPACNASLPEWRVRVSADGKVSGRAGDPRPISREGPRG